MTMMRQALTRKSGISLTTAIYGKFGTLSSSEVREFIKKETVVSVSHLTPEVKLHLITEKCRLWNSKNDCELSDPFWAFYWPGGQAVSRYVLDNPSIVQKKCVLDFGCGCGASGISSLMSQAKKVIFNDIDEVALTAVQENCKINGIQVDQLVSDDLVGSSCTDVDVILVGDMLYDEEFADKVLSWLQKLSTSGKSILIGDPGRYALQNHGLKQLKLMVRYRLPPSVTLENYGHVDSGVWTFR